MNIIIGNKIKQKEKKMNRLKEWRYTNRVTLEEFAKIAKVSYLIVWKFEHDKKISEKMKFYINHKLDELMAEKEEK